MPPAFPTIAIPNVETSSFSAGGDGDLILTLGPSANGTSIITLAGLAFGYVVAQPADRSLTMLAGGFDFSSLEVNTRQAGLQVVYFNPAWQFTLVRSAAVNQQLIISLQDPGGGNGNCFLNALGYSHRFIPA